jgi:hypothetical protein
MWRAAEESAFVIKPHLPDTSESPATSLSMSSNIFDNLQSPVSYDAEIDKGWQLISEKIDNPVASILHVLLDTYWTAVTDEIANALLAFDDYKTFCPNGLPKVREDVLESDYLQELVDLWGMPILDMHQEVLTRPDPLGLSDDKKKDLCETVMQNVKSEYLNRSLPDEYSRTRRKTRLTQGRAGGSLLTSSMRYVYHPFWETN